MRRILGALEPVGLRGAAAGESMPDRLLGVGVDETQAGAAHRGDGGTRVVFRARSTDGADGRDGLLL